MSSQNPISNPEYFIGLMSGTSLDGVDAVLVDFSGNSPKLISSHCHPIPFQLKKTVLNTIKPNWVGSLEAIGILNQQLGELFADAAVSLINQDSRYSIQASSIKAIGSHGQTLWHQPFGKHPFTMQFSELDAFGYDTGPGNGLIDAWISKHHSDHSYDKNGEWGRSGKVVPELLQILLNDSYFTKTPPKSTGKEAFNLEWLEPTLGKRLIKEKPEDIQATLTELTAKSIADCINNHQTEHNKLDELYLCGGGIHNLYLTERIQHHLKNIFIASTADIGIDPDWMEAIAFAWLAKQTLEGNTSNLPAVTGADGKRLLGSIHPH